MKPDPTAPSFLFSVIRDALQELLKDRRKAFQAQLKRWRNTLSNDDLEIPLHDAQARFLTRYGILDAGQKPEIQLERYRTLLNQLARSTGEAPGVLDAWFGLFAEGADDLLDRGICDQVPACSRCPLCEQCRYIALGARPEKLAGRSMQEKLLQPEQPVRAGSAELLAFLCSEGSSGTREVARMEAALLSAGSMRGLMQLSPQDLAEMAFSEAQIARLRGLSQLLQYWREETEPRGRQFTQGRDFFEHYHLQLRELKKERFFVVCLDQKHRLIGDELVSEGTLTEALVHPREVFAPAIRLRAAAVALLHNHPSGDPSPSREDIQLTQRLREAATLLGIRLLDHVIVGDGRYVSFVDEHLL